MSSSTLYSSRGAHRRGLFLAADRPIRSTYQAQHQWRSSPLMINTMVLARVADP
jgi:hypothetical protein